MTSQTHSLSPPPPSHYGATNEDSEEHTTSGRTYEELVQQYGQHSSSSLDSPLSNNDDDDDNSLEYNHRTSVGCFLTGRNSLSNWTTFQNNESMLEEDDDDDTNHHNVPMSSVKGGDVRVSSLETPMIARLDSSKVNFSQRSKQSQQQRMSDKRFSARQEEESASTRHRQSQLMNLSHISSSSSSLGEDILGESWSPIRSHLENDSPTKNVNGSMILKSPLKDDGTTSVQSLTRRKSRSKSPKKSSPTRSPLADISPNRKSSSRRGGYNRNSLSPKKSPLQSTLKEALSPHGTYSLKEADGISAEQQQPPTTHYLSSHSKTANKKSSSPAKSKLILPTLGRKNQGGGALLFSPEKSTGMIHERSPVPTPNSQRRVIKRLRASLPTAECIEEDEVMEEEKETQKEELKENNNEEKGKVSSISIAKQSTETEPSALDKSQSFTLPPANYENEFLFPPISRPRDATLAFFHKEAIAIGPSSHQYQLKVAGTNCISMQEVILPAIAYDTNEVLKKLQAKAQRNVKDGMPDSKGKDVVDVIDTCRLVVKKCTSQAITQAGQSWRDREETRQQALLERHAQDMEQQKKLRAQAKLQRKEERALAKQQSYERQRYEKQKSHPRNKKMWREVAKLMMEIQKLEKEESLWKAALSEVKAMEQNYQPPEKMDLTSLEDVTSNHLREEKQEKLCHAVEDTNLETKCTTLIQDVTVATERISWMLQSVSLAMNESDRLRQEAYQKYQYEGHKFYGYQTGDSKGLFSALSMDDSFAC